MIEISRARGWLVPAALALAAVVLAGFPATGREPGLSPVWSIPEPPSAGWAGVHALPDGAGWLVCGGDTVWRVDGAGVVTPLVRSVADGGILRHPLNLAVGPRTLLVYDRETANFVEVERATGKAVRSLVFTKAGGVPYAGSSWNGSRWVLAGYMKDANGTPLEIQARDATTFAFAGGTPLTAEERSLTGMLLPTGSVSGGPGGMTLLSFHSLGRAIIVDENGAERLSLVLPILPDRALLPGSVKAPPTTEGEHRALHRGKTVPMGTGWMESDPCVLLADLGRGDGALRWCRFSIRTGALVSQTVLGLGSRDPGDWFSAAASTSGGNTTVAVLSWPYSAGGKRSATLHGFRVPGASSRRQER